MECVNREVQKSCTGWTPFQHRKSTGMKRTGPNHRKSKVARIPDTGYTGHVTSPGETVSSVENFNDFYNSYVKARKPVKITGTTNHPVDLKKLRVDTIVNTLGYPDKLQVERKHGYGFGLGLTRELMTMSLIVEKLALGDDTYYLTTQYDSHDVEDEDATGKDGSEALDQGSDDNGGEEEEKQDNDNDDDDDDDDDEVGSFGDSADFDGSENFKRAEISTNGVSPDSDKIDPHAIQTIADVESDSDYEDLENQLKAFSNGDIHDDFEDDDNDISSDSDSIENYADPENKLTADDIEFRVRTLLQPPLTTLAHDETFPISPAPFDKLVTQQINLWMGASLDNPAKPDLLRPSRHSLRKYVPSGNSSGLHHDHADNLYVLTEGRKRFTLYSPADAHTLYTVGNINKVYGNGLVDYKVNKHAPHWRHMREDGAIIGEHARWMLEKDECSGDMRAQLMDALVNEEVYNGTSPDKLDPPSFSTVPPILAHLDELTDKEEIDALTAFANKEFPGFLQLNKMEVWLEPGDMFYLPCGWFHEVTSYSSELGSAHIALNWWFMPPATSEDTPYQDDYWKEDFTKTLAAIQYVKDHGS